MLGRYLFKGTIKDESEHKDAVYPKGHSFQAEAVLSSGGKKLTNSKQP
jgi:hypothetical protein